MEEPIQNNTLIELHVNNFQKVKDYYGKLGFKIIWERQPEESKGYLVMTLGNNTLCFWAGNEKAHEHEYFGQFPKTTPKGYGVEVVIMVEDVETYYEKVKDFANVREGLQEKPWGLKDFRTVDPFGYYLRFTSKHNIHDSIYAVK